MKTVKRIARTESNSAWFGIELTPEAASLLRVLAEKDKVDPAAILADILTGGFSAVAINNNMESIIKVLQDLSSPVKRN